MYRIAKTFTFAAAHHLPSLPSIHKCHRVHGHNYAVTLVVQSRGLDANGMVLDYGVMGSTFGTWLKETYDHRDLNDVMVVEPTAENLAADLHNTAVAMFPAFAEGLVVRVAETAGTWAEFSHE